MNVNADWRIVWYARASTFSGHLRTQMFPLASMAAQTMSFWGWATVPIVYFALNLFAVLGIHALIWPPIKRGFWHFSKTLLIERTRANSKNLHIWEDDFVPSWIGQQWFCELHPFLLVDFWQQWFAHWMHWSHSWFLIPHSCTFQNTRHGIMWQSSGNLWWC